MDAFTYRHAELACEALPLSTLADAVGTPASVYSPGALAGDREMPRVEEGPRPREVLVDGDRFAVVRRRETYEDLVAGEETS